MLKKILPEKFRVSAACVLIAFAAVLILWVFDPKTTKWLPKCFFNQLTGFYCPGCGNTRALYHLIHGDFLLSLRNNCLLIPAMFSVVIALIFPGLALKRSVCYTVLTVTVLFFILRNIPISPFNLLAPV